MWRLCVQRNEPSPSLNWRYPLTMAPLTDACSLGTPRERKRDSISDRPSRGRGGTEEETSSAREMRSRRNSGTLRGEAREARGRGTPYPTETEEERGCRGEMLLPRRRAADARRAGEISSTSSCWISSTKGAEEEATDSNDDRSSSSPALRSLSPLEAKRATRSRMTATRGDGEGPRQAD